MLAVNTWKRIADAPELGRLARIPAGLRRGSRRTGVVTAAPIRTVHPESAAKRAHARVRIAGIVAFIAAIAVATSAIIVVRLLISADRFPNLERVLREVLGS
jgi:hypothetical protein